ncbi:hypothetical protein AVEN_167663-1, partial [Araneus ventricosus]
MSENTAKRPQFYRRKKRRFYGNQFTKLKAAASENQESENVDSNITNLDENTVEFSKNIS